MASEQSDIQPDISETWHQERQARVQAERQRVEAQEALISNAYAGLESQWAELDRAANGAYDSLDLRESDRIRDERQRLREEASKLQDGYSALQQEKAQIEFAERATKLDFNGLRDLASEKSKLFLDVFRSKLQDPASLRRLLHADSVARSKHTPDTNDYFAEVERLCGFSPEERRFEFESDNNTTTDKPARRTAEQKDKFEPTAEQKWMAKELAQHGIPEKDYLAQCSNPFSEAHTATVEVEPADFDTGAHKSIEVSFDETPKKPTVDASRYKPNPATSTTLSKAELDLIDSMTAGQGDKARDEMRKSFAANKIALHQGKAGHYQLYDAKLRSEGRA